MKKVYIETYGCQMNAADSEVVGAIVKKEGYELTDDVYEADIIFVNTCSIRENAEQRVKKRLVGPDSYRDIPSLLLQADNQPGISVELSTDETYSDINPVKLHSNGVTA